MSTHEEAFKIPSGHTLKQTGYTGKGPVANDEDWKHEEYDADGKLVARYESWHHVDVHKGGKISTGFKKYDAEGALIEESEQLFT